MIPVVLLTGFLGSGKTTLLSRWLKQPEFQRTAVVINEFGEAGLDHHLVSSAEDGIVALTNGCLCCRVQTDLARTLGELVHRRNCGEIAFDRLVIETSGLADPVPILQALGTDLSVTSHYRIETTVTVVDAVSGANALTRYPEARRQIGVADTIVISKRDIATEEEIEAIGKLLDKMGATANRPAAGNVAGMSGMGNVPAHDERGPYKRLALKESIAGGHVHGAGAGESADTAGYDTVIIEREEPIDASVIPLFLEGVAAHEGTRLLRLKGIVQVTEMPDRPMVLHGVQNVYFAPSWLEDWPTDRRFTRIVMIGHGLSASWSHALLTALEAEVREVKYDATSI